MAGVKNDSLNIQNLLMAVFLCIRKARQFLVPPVPYSLSFSED